MLKDGLPPETVRLLRAYIDSVGMLEILLFLHGARDRAYTPAEINEKLRSNLDSVERRLSALLANGLVSAEESTPATFRFAPATAELEASVETLARLYPLYRVRIIDVIYNPENPMKTFSDAFRLKKDPEDNG